MRTPSPTNAARALAALRTNPGRKPETHEQGCSSERPCIHCQRRAYRRERYERTGKR